jgi:maltose alpha-D-glucosyltransferase/alpha-amylase
VNFIRKHDELNLGKLKPEEREEVFNVFAPEERMRIYGRGIRRRLAPMLNNDRQKIEVMYSLMFSLPGTSLIRYGDEIGMGENLHLKGRESIRTVMQWSSGVNGGFSTAKTHALVTPVISGGDFGFENVNVARQLEENNSMLHWMRRMIQCRKELNVTSMSKFVMLDSEHEAVIAFMYEEYNTRFLTFHNVSETPVTCELPDGLGRLTSCFGNGVINGSKLLLGRYGYAWLKTV